MQLHLTGLDLGVILGYLLATLLIGYATRRVSPTIEAYVLGGRRLTLPLFVGTLVSTWYGGILGVGEIAFSAGLVNWLTQGLFWYLAYAIFALVLARRLRESLAVTLPEQLDRFYGRRAYAIGAVLNFLNTVPVAYVLSLGLMLQLFFGLSLPLGVLLGAAVVCLYTLRGGFRSDVYTDMFQMVVMCCGVAAVIPFAVFTLGGADYLRAHLPAQHLTWGGGWSLQELLVWLTIAMTTLVDPQFYQRCYAAQSARVAQVGIFLSIGFWCMFDICTTFGAIYARAALPASAPVWGYPLLADQIRPTGLRGLFFAGVLATIMSTVDSYALVAATTLGRDLYGRILRPTISEAAMVRASRWGLVFTALLAAGFALVFEGSIRAVWKSFGSLVAGGLLVPMLAGLLRPGRWRPAAGVAALLLGSGVTAAALVLQSLGFSPVPQVEPLFLGLGASLLGLLMVGRMQRQ